MPFVVVRHLRINNIFSVYNHVTEGEIKHLYLSFNCVTVLDSATKSSSLGKQSIESLGAEQEPVTLAQGCKRRHRKLLNPLLS